MMLALKRTAPATNTNFLDISIFSATVVAEGQNRPANDSIEPTVAAGYTGEEDLTVEEWRSVKKTPAD
ncbi:hypothetical protein Bca52824_017776 [Brassica carinata]|uniref:Uncharacterized protein n=1 Tax=Brassica carinata TaxID=52824 RepID=A0A8X7VN95_BRACI|nr:hypothetical protein Bca52824_017776 [Brassica carinata]